MLNVTGWVKDWRKYRYIDDRILDQAWFPPLRRVDYNLTRRPSQEKDSHMQELTMNAYQKLAEKTSGAGEFGERRQIIAALGMAGEAGEFANMIKKLTAHGHDISKETLAEELGDVLWYLAEAATALELKLNDIAQMNVDKLAARYPEGFSQERSRNREK